MKVAAAVEEAVKENLYTSVRSDRGFNHHWPSDLGCRALLPFIAKLSGLTRLAIANVDNSFEEVLSRRGWDVHDELPPADEDPNWRQGLDTVLSGIKEFTAWSVQYRDQLAERMPRLEVAVLEGHQGVVGPATQSTRSIRHLRTGYSPSPPPRHYDDRTPSTAPFFAVLMANQQTLESLHIGRQLDHQPLATSLAHITAPSLRQLKVSTEIGGPLLGTLAEFISRATCLEDFELTGFGSEADLEPLLRTLPASIVSLVVPVYERYGSTDAAGEIFRRTMDLVLGCAAQAALKTVLVRLRALADPSGAAEQLRAVVIGEVEAHAQDMGVKVSVEFQPVVEYWMRA